MSAFGENLRREREMRGVSLGEISSATKISLRFLEAIEREEFSKLPGGIFSRSFIRSYAHYLGLDEDRVVAEFQQAAKPQTDFDLHRMAAGNASFSRPSDRKTLFASVVALALLVTGYVLFRYSRRAAEAPPPPPPPVVNTAPVAPPPALPPQTSVDASASPSSATGVGSEASVPGALGTPGTPGAASSAASSASATKPSTPQGAANSTPSAATSAPPATGPNTKPVPSDLVLQVAATERAWISIEADHKMVFQRVLNPNEVQTLHADKVFDLTVGNAQSIILTLNGETLKPLGRRGEVKSIRLTRDDLKNTTP
jgi:cytoskeleton protein RodZ